MAKKATPRRKGGGVKSARAYVAKAAARVATKAARSGGRTRMSAGNIRAAANSPFRKAGPSAASASSTD